MVPFSPHPGGSEEWLHSKTPPRGGRTASREFIFAESAAHLPYKFAYKICVAEREKAALELSLSARTV